METPTKEKRPIWQIGLTLIVVLVSGFAAKQCTQSVFQRGQRALTPQADIEAQLDRYATSDPVFSSFREAFPEDWQTFRAQTAADAKSSMSMSELKVSSASRLRQFMVAHVAWTKSAPDDDLKVVLAAERGFTEQLQREDENLCARFGMTGLRGDEPLSAKVTAQASQVAVARIKATRAGRDNPVHREAPVEADGQALVAGMTASGASDRIIDLMLSGVGEGSPRDQCTGTVALYQSMDRMPEAQGTKLYATIIAAAAATPPAPAT